MQKLLRHYYYSKTGEKKINCYKVSISKELLKQTDIKETDELNIYVKDNKIIVERAK